MGKEYRVFGPPGTGKTGKIKNEIVPQLIDKYGEQNIMLTSFTKTAAAELSSRLNLKDSQNIGTLHSICFHGLKTPDMTENHMKEWRERYPGYDFSKGAYNNPAVEINQKYQIYRNKAIPESKWEDDIIKFKRCWENFKQETGSLDFIDLIEQAGNKLFSPPGNPRAIIIDEAQDLCKIEMNLLRQWGMQVDEFYTVGDDDQAQPSNTEILTTNGKKKIQEINPETDRLIIFNKDKSSTNSNKGNGYKFEIKSRLYTGYIYNFQTDKEITKCTEDHLWQVKWNKRPLNYKIVYLMKKGDCFRVGMCQLFREEKSNGNREPSLHLRTRMNQEKAEAAWILNICEDTEKASIYESFINTLYGITTIMFKDNSGGHNRSLYSQDNIDLFFNLMPDQISRAIKCLEEHDLNIRYPFITNENYSKFGSSVFKMRASNIAKLQEFDLFFQIPVRSKETVGPVKWKPFEVFKEWTENETVYSMGVEKYHTYIADNICTCNCIFSFAGSSPENMLYPEVPDNQKEILTHSWRVPEKVHQVANKIIKRVGRRQVKDYEPRDGDPGSVVDGDGTFNSPEWLVDKIQGSEGSCMILVSCNYMLQEITKRLRTLGVPFSNPWRKDDKSWNPLNNSGTQILKDFLGNGPDAPYWDTEQFVSWAQHLKVSSTGLVRKKGKAGIKTLNEHLEKETPGLHTSREYLSQLLSPDAVEPALNRDISWLFQNLQKVKQDVIQYPITLYKKHGKEVLEKEPQVYIGTIHSFKGGEADNVFVFPDISYTTKIESGKSIEHFESLCRLFYVAVTRSRKNLILMPPASQNFFNF